MDRHGESQLLDSSTMQECGSPINLKLVIRKLIPDLVPDDEYIMMTLIGLANDLIQRSASHECQDVDAALATLPSMSRTLHFFDFSVAWNVSLAWGVPFLLASGPNVRGVVYERP